MVDKTLNWDAEFYQNSSSLQFELGLMGIKRLNPNGSEKILEIGCGNAMLTIELAKKNMNGTITAVEVSQEMIAQAKANIATHRISNIEIIHGDAIQINYQDEFDAIYSNSAIHWIKNLELMYEKLFNALKKDGRILIQTGLKSMNSVVKTIFKLVTLKKYRSALRDFKNPWRYLTFEETAELLNSLQFKNINIEEYNHLVKYDTEEGLLNYFKSAALVPFLTILPDDLKDEFIDDFRQIFLNYNNNRLEVEMKRLFISAKK
ncbi:MAG: class I SAM-dependent methyltransferase [Promethearchaeota archaeon]|nr:MAG: class I SAM-dependent methyltransferase [Candidatus Lokiarchaeota archaeon]